MWLQAIKFCLLRLAVITLVVPLLLNVANDMKHDYNNKLIVFMPSEPKIFVRAAEINNRAY